MHFKKDVAEKGKRELTDENERLSKKLREALTKDFTSEKVKLNLEQKIKAYEVQFNTAVSNADKQMEVQCQVGCPVAVRCVSAHG